MSIQNTPLPFPELDLHLLRRPEMAEDGRAVELRGRQLPALRIPANALGGLAMDFDTLQARLAELPRMFLELDGSFMWAGSHLTNDWRIDGMIFENARTVRWVEIKGQCPLSAWDQLLMHLGHDMDPLVALWLPEQCFLEVEQVRSFWNEVRAS